MATAAASAAARAWRGRRWPAAVLEAMSSRRRGAVGRPLAASRRAAVLVPLLDVAGEASVLFTKRHAGLRAHGGEVSFPGGLAEACDADAEATAVRETHEELGAAPAALGLRVLHRLPPLLSKAAIAVTPVVAQLRHGEAQLPALKPSGEVDAVFTVPLWRLLEPSRQGTREGAHPLPGGGRLLMPTYEGPHGWEIWGLTAYILRIVLRDTEAAQAALDQQQSEPK